jgi:predicted dehydrogenase
MASRFTADGMSSRVLTETTLPNLANPARPVRLAIVGCGAVTGSYHLPALARIPEIEVCILCDQNLDNAIKLKRQFGVSAAVTESVGEVAGKVDAALVAVPPRFHAPLTVQLLDSGIDVLCEKPLALTADEAIRMVEVAQKNGRYLAVGLCKRFEPNNLILQKLVQGGGLGEIREVIAEFGNALNWHMPTASYYSRETTRGGVLFDTGIHVVDLILWMFGDLNNIEFEDDSYDGVESNAVLCGTLQIQGREVPCRMVFSWTHALNNGIRVVGQIASAQTSFRNTDFVTVHQTMAGEQMEMRTYRMGPGFPLTGSDCYVDQLVDFAAAVSERHPPFVTASSTIKALSAIERAYAVRKRMAQPWVEANGSDRLLQ